MTSSQPTTHTDLPEVLERLVRAHDQEVVRLREKFGDPRLALFILTRDRLDRESLVGSASQHGDVRAGGEDDDDDLDAWQRR